jgi:hypothetical protein
MVVDATAKNGQLGLHFAIHEREPPIRFADGGAGNVRDPFEPSSLSRLYHMGNAFVFLIVVDADVYSIAARERLLDIRVPQGIAFYNLKGFGELHARAAGIA